MNPKPNICECCGEPSEGSLCAFCSLVEAQHEQQVVLDEHVFIGGA